MSRHGKKWTKEEDEKLKKLFREHASFSLMGKELDRTWFACKCRLARLGLIDMSVDGNFKWAEKYKIPNPPSFDELCNFLKDTVTGSKPADAQCEKNKNTFSNDELDIVSTYLKTRYAKVMIALSDGPMYARELELKKAEEILENEIRVINCFKRMGIQEREKVLKKLC